MNTSVFIFFWAGCLSSKTGLGILLNKSKIRPVGLSQNLGPVEFKPWVYLVKSRARDRPSPTSVASLVCIIFRKGGTKVEKLTQSSAAFFSTGVEKLEMT
jgi:hypothetical protein